jgi:hypothetical protein
LNPGRSIAIVWTTSALCSSSKALANASRAFFTERTPSAKPMANPTAIPSAKRSPPRDFVGGGVWTAGSVERFTVRIYAVVGLFSPVDPGDATRDHHAPLPDDVLEAFEAKL